MHSTATITKIDTDEVYSLKERVRQLERLLGRDWLAPNVLRLTRSETRVLGVIIKRSPLCTYETIYDVLYGAASDPPSEQLVKVYTSKIRSKLAPYGVEINTYWGRGYFITPENLERLESLYGPGERPTTESP